jgi:tetratricopeptide (TPR) repeat protein
LGWETHDLHQYDPRDLPVILSHFNQVRECWRDNLRTAVVFIVPPFVIRYLILRCPDFYDWRLGTFVLPKDEGMYQEQLDNWMRSSRFKEYMELAEPVRLSKILALRDSLEDDSLTDFQKAKLLQEQGRLFQSNNDNYLALSCHNMSVKLNPDNSEIWLNHGYSLACFGRAEEALISYDKSLECQPNNYIAWYYRGWCLMTLKRWQEALATYDKALEYEAESDPVWYYRGWCLMRLERWREALASYDKALEYEESESDPVWYYRGLCLIELKHWEEALASYDKALEYKLTYYPALLGRHLCLIKLKRLEEALAKSDEILGSQLANSLESHFYSSCLRILELSEEAITSFK